MAEKMNIAFIGCGGFTSGNHIPNAVANPNFEVIAFCDLDQDRLATLDQKYQPRYVTTDMEKIFRDPEVELVVCGTKPDFRLPIMKLAVQHGKHLFVEKPLCFLEEEVEEMVALMNAAPTLFMVGFNRPYSEPMQDAKKYFQQFRKGNTTIIYRIIGESSLWPKHHYDAVVHEGESTIIHETTHIFDLLNWLTDAEPTKVYTAGGGNLDNIITLTYPDDVTAVVISGDNSCVGYPKENLEINTNHGIIKVEYFIELLVMGFNGFYEKKNYPYYIGSRTVTGTAEEAARQNWEWRKSVTQEEMEMGYYYERQLTPDKGHYNELEAFRKMIRKGEKSETDVVRGALANLIAWRAIESWEKGMPVDIDYSYLKTL